jgi:hypothetical protein
LLALAGCTGGGSGALTRSAGTPSTSSSSTSSSSTTSSSTTPSSTAPSPTAPATTRRTTTPQTPIPGPVVIRYRVERHTDDEATANFASMVDATLNDPRSWTRAGFVF